MGPVKICIFQGPDQIFDITGSYATSLVATFLFVIGFILVIELVLGDLNNIKAILHLKKKLFEFQFVDNNWVQCHKSVGEWIGNVCNSFASKNV